MSSGSVWRNSLQYEEKVKVYRIGSREQLTRDDLPAWGFGEVLKTAHLKSDLVTKQIHVPQVWTYPKVRLK